ncbi:extensin [Aquibium carbonis]|uniref:Extensin n=1 Tax=Aquibium carbonis TaxID=2495581 RepID=A0A429Z1A3_9HYPH|nr:extensin family protein [Aquibium carbonis]RST87414.1 extensin [Aquibium carbonis]
MRFSKGLFLLPALLLVMAAVDLPDEAPLPTDDPRPAEARSPAEPDAGPAAPASPDETTPPDDEAEADQAKDDEAVPDAAEKKPDPIADAPPPEPLSDAELAACEAELTRLGAVFMRLDPIEGEGGCGVPQPYDLPEPAPGVTLEPDTQVTCPVALATARWVRDVAQPAARALGEGVALTGLAHASTYVCRGRNGQPGARISEHATGGAIDISRFLFDGHEPLTIVPRKGQGNIEEAFQRTVQAGACLHFTTVLGPGSDAFHDDHLHLDVAARRSGFRLCQ